MRVIRYLCLIIAWFGVAALSVAHILLTMFTKGMGSSTLSLENVMALQPLFGLVALPIVGLFWGGGWQPWRGICVSAGAQAVVFALIIFSLRSEYDQSFLEKSGAATCLIVGFAAIWLACNSKTYMRAAFEAR